MIVTISQPRYLPWLGYFHRMVAADVFVYLDTVQYSPRDWENRNKVKVKNGWTWLTVPVNAEYQALIPDVAIDNSQAWQERHWRTLITHYGSAPYFHRYAACLEPIYRERRWERLTDLNFALIDALCASFGFQPRFIRASTLTARGRGSQLLLNHCLELGATVYLSGAEGRNYLDHAAFDSAGIRIAYQDYVHPEYPQLHPPFLPGMAAVDLLFNCGPESARVMTADQPAVA